MFKNNRGAASTTFSDRLAAERKTILAFGVMTAACVTALKAVNKIRQQTAKAPTEEIGE